MGLYRGERLTGLSPSQWVNAQKEFVLNKERRPLSDRYCWTCMKANEAKKLLDLNKLHEAKMDNVMGM